MALPRRLFLLYHTAAIVCLGSAFTFPSSLSSGIVKGSLHRPLTLSSSVVVHSSHHDRSSSMPRLPTTLLHESSQSDNEDVSISAISDSEERCWNPNLRKQLGAISTLGLLETAYLTYDKIQYSSSGGGKASSLVGALCSTSGASSCTDVLHGPYASLHLPGGLDVPLSALGMAAYTSVLLLAALPLFSSESNDNDVLLDGDNRISLLGGTTLMATFSIYLVSLLVGVIHASCLFCFVSAGLSVSMAALSWFGGMLPDAEEQKLGADNSLADVMELRKKGATFGASSVGLATVMALVLFVGVTDENGNFSTMSASSTSSANSGTLLASTASTKSFQDNIPPPITTHSSKSALALAADMKSLNSRMFGAFWCSHCYDQKQTLGFEAMQSLPYIECDREGYNNKRDMCKEREVPGYPTWEIGGELFPGERSLEELREIVDDVMSSGR